MLAPPLCWRVGTHTSLMSHWLILASLWSYFATGAKRETRPLRGLVLLNCTLLAISSGVHPYIGAMLAGLILAAYLRAYLLALVSLRNALALILSIPAILVAGWWFFGYFSGTIQSEGDWLGYGKFALNLNSFLDPQTFSLFLDPLRIPSRQEGGFAYLGIGLMALILLNSRYLLTRLIAGFRTPSLIPLCVHCLAYLVFALGNNIYFGDEVVFRYPLPKFVSEIFDIFRASNRFVWPVFYVIMATTLAGSFRFVDRRSYQVLLCIALVIQFTDLIPLHSGRRSLVHRDPKLDSPLLSPEWNDLAPRHDKLLLFPSSICKKGRSAIAPFPLFARIAAEQGLKLNDFHFARPSKKIRHLHCDLMPDAVRAGKLDRRAAYVLHQKSYRKTIARIRKDKNATHTCSRIDRFTLCVRR